MIESRRAAGPIGPSTCIPWESGPRCTSVALIAASRSGSIARPVEAVPQMPHMPDYLTHVPLAEFATHEELQLLVLLLSRAPLLLLAEPLRIPYPILLVLGGLVLGFGPGVPNITLPPGARLRGPPPARLF